MIEELKEIRKRLENAVASQDWWTVKSQMNKIDTIIYNDHESKVIIRFAKIVDVNLKQ